MKQLLRMGWFACEHTQKGNPNPIPDLLLSDFLSDSLPATLKYPARDFAAPFPQRDLSTSSSEIENVDTPFDNFALTRVCPRRRRDEERRECFMVIARIFRIG